ncbi:RNA-binding domain-containing protein, partial [Trichoderma citrinoviride]
MASDKMDRGLDEIIADKRSNGSRNRRGGDRRRDRQDYPRDGVKKSLRNEPRNLDSEWVHDRYEENSTVYRNRGPAPRRRRESPSGGDARGTRLRVENIHYDLTEEDLDELFRRIGPITKLQLRYDRSGRSEGVAFVTYESRDDAAEAVRQFDGANANGQPIRLTILSGGPSRNPFDTAVMPGKPLSERISAPGGRSRSLSPHRRYDEEDAARRGIDRYVPGGSRSRSPMPPRRGGGRRPGARREGGGRDQDAARGGRQGGGNGGNGRAARTNTPRPKKTQEELDAEMEDYFNANGGAAEPAAEAAAEASAPNGEAAAPANADDIDM